jgi:hypothetical protein
MYILKQIFEENNIENNFGISLDEWVNQVSSEFLGSPFFYLDNTYQCLSEIDAEQIPKITSTEFIESIADSKETYEEYYDESWEEGLDF